nr:hypothetical protein [Thermobacillus composti]
MYIEIYQLKQLGLNVSQIARKTEHFSKHRVQISEHVAGRNAGIHRIGEDAAKEAGSV